jgi:hypothetical protein
MIHGSSLNTKLLGLDFKNFAQILDSSSTAESRTMKPGYQISLITGETKKSKCRKTPAQAS